LLVCHCNNVCDRVIRQCVRAGARSLEAVTRECQAGSECGGCLPLVQHLVLAERAQLEDAKVSSAPAAVAA
jgi:bacterioferritin-associated ferredoxin